MSWKKSRTASRSLTAPNLKTTTKSIKLKQLNGLHPPGYHTEKKSNLSKQMVKLNTRQLITTPTVTPLNCHSSNWGPSMRKWNMVWFIRPEHIECVTIIHVPWQEGKNSSRLGITPNTIAWVTHKPHLPFYRWTSHQHNGGDTAMTHTYTGPYHTVHLLRLLILTGKTENACGLSSSKPLMPNTSVGQNPKTAYCKSSHQKNKKRREGWFQGWKHWLQSGSCGVSLYALPKALSYTKSMN